MDETHEGGRRRVEVPLLLDGAATWGWRILVVSATAALIGFLLIELYVVVVPVVLALFLAAVLEPLTAKLRARGWHRALAATTVFLVAVVVLAGLLFWIGASVAHQFTDVGDQFQAGIDDMKDWAQGDPLNLTAERVDQLESDIRGMADSAVGGLAEQAAGQARAAGEALGGVVLLLFTLFFLLKDGSRITDWIRDRIPPDHLDDAVAVTLRARQVMRQYLIATAATGLIDGVLIGVALWVLGVPLVVPLAVLTFLGGFIPIAGATVAGLVAAVVALVTNGVGTALLVVAATIAVQQIEGNLLQPLILERAVRLHPLVTVWAVAAGLVVGGLLGAFLSVPLLAIAVGFASHFRIKTGPIEAGPIEAGQAPTSPVPRRAMPRWGPPADPDAG